MFLQLPYLLSGMPGSMMTFGYFFTREKNISSMQYMLISAVDTIITFLFLFNGKGWTDTKRDCQDQKISLKSYNLWLKFSICKVPHLICSNESNWFTKLITYHLQQDCQSLTKGGPWCSDTVGSVLVGPLPGRHASDCQYFWWQSLA